ncbi:hypothetical protein EDB80DRAFT_812796 [Ilyonectria destructans]|nr:hypothetical protein EDB80DRAFT_812796 [Ilyonectria destructans]
MVVRTAWFIMWLSPFLVAIIIRVSKHEPGRVDDLEYVPPLEQLVYPAQRHRDPHPDLVAIKVNFGQVAQLQRRSRRVHVLWCLSHRDGDCVVGSLRRRSPDHGHVSGDEFPHAALPVLGHLHVQGPIHSPPWQLDLPHRQHPVFADGAKCNTQQRETTNLELAFVAYSFSFGVGYIVAECRTRTRARSDCPTVLCEFTVPSFLVSLLPTIESRQVVNSQTHILLPATSRRSLPLV